MDLYNVIKNDEKYWLVDQVDGQDASESEYKEQFKNILDGWKSENVGYLSLLMNEAYHDWLKKSGLQYVTSTVEYTKRLTDSPINTEIQYHSLAEGLMTDAEYGDLYEKSSSDSANKNVPQEKGLFLESLERELGAAWRDNCYYFMKINSKIGIAIPHIEMGTRDEGRLFYFGVVPKWRGKGVGKHVHKITLKLLAEKWNAAIYVGSTDVGNAHMIHIFKENGCVLRGRKGMYRIESFT